jgi:hypothetical protein
VTAVHPLDNPVWSSLTGPHARFAQRRGSALRYPADVSPFASLPENPDDDDWADLAGLAGAGAMVLMAGSRVLLPAGWPAAMAGEGVQLIDAGVEPASAGEAVRLGPADVPEMLELAKRTKPGPFLPRTRELTGAIRLYEALGFRLRRGVLFSALRGASGRGRCAPAPLTGRQQPGLRSRPARESGT